MNHRMTRQFLGKVAGEQWWLIIELRYLLVAGDLATLQIPVQSVELHAKCGEPCSKEVSFLYGQGAMPHPSFSVSPKTYLCHFLNIYIKTIIFN